ncbi:hypothetical protein PPYR_13604 [Photinus pyralis]|uniref:Uncharacterized protein n=1 Tax=Photinus pyralis TaxID=7054 RepID=A0A1Y1MU38_PHOPY|nr:general odorant-binding protein 99b-like [Photinus pyralis]KAB0793984.1 hypothetical protein PPYR_13604 [Photinus pyralis]
MLKLVVLVSLFAASLASFKFNVKPELVQSWHKFTLPPHDVCVDKEYISKERLDSAFENMEFPDDTQFKCMVVCIFERLKFYNKGKGTYNHEVMIEEINGLTQEIADKCYKTRGSADDDDCEHIFHGATCAIRALEE